MSGKQDHGSSSATEHTSPDGLTETPVLAGERNAADYVAEFGGYLAKAVEAFLDFLNEDRVFADTTLTTAQYDALADHRRNLRLAIHQFDTRADRYLQSRTADTSASAFVLGEVWPDWFAVLHMHNIAVTGNYDGRWRGGPDFAEIRRPDGSVLVKKLGHTISPRDFFAPFPAESGANSPKAQPECRDGQYVDEPKPIPPPPPTPQDGVAET